MVSFCPLRLHLKKQSEILNLFMHQLTQMVKNMSAMQESQVRSLGQEDPLEKGMVTHSSILARRIPQRSLVGYSPWGHKESGNMTEQLTHQPQGLKNY